MVCDRHWVLLIKINTSYISVPAHTPTEILRVEVDFCFTWPSLESFVAAVTQVLGPCYAGDYQIMVVLLLDENENIKSEASNEDH